MKPIFTIITTTCKRPEHILKALGSVQAQAGAVHHLIVIDDTLSDYSQLKKACLENPKITLIQNSINQGKNASVNTALTLLRIQQFSGYIIFLDDDDWLAVDCVAQCSVLIETTPKANWFVLNRTNAADNIPFTKNLTPCTKISYLYDTLLRKRFTGDATHCIYFPTIAHITFPTPIKNAEEWVYFAHLSSIYPTFLYQNVTGTLSYGYSEQGLTDLYHKRREQKRNIQNLVKIIWQRRLLHPVVVCYVFYRLLRSLR